MTPKFELFYQRIMSASGCETDKELAEYLEKSTLSMWKKRERVDYRVLFTKLEQTDLNWLIRGTEAESNDSKSIDQRLEYVECAIEAIKLKMKIEDEIDQVVKSVRKKKVR